MWKFHLINRFKVYEILFANILINSIKFHKHFQALFKHPIKEKRLIAFVVFVKMFNYLESWNNNDGVRIQSPCKQPKANWNICRCAVHSFNLNLSEHENWIKTKNNHYSQLKRVLIVINFLTLLQFNNRIRIVHFVRFVPKYYIISHCSNVAVFQLNDVEQCNVPLFFFLFFSILRKLKVIWWGQSMTSFIIAQSSSL